jgi:hypothetical protein
VDVGAASVAGAQAAHAVERGEGALDDVADLAQALACGTPRLAIFDRMPQCRSRRRKVGKSLPRSAHRIFSLLRGRPRPRPRTRGIALSKANSCVRSCRLPPVRLTAGVMPGPARSGGISSRGGLYRPGRARCAHRPASPARASRRPRHAPHRSAPPHTDLRAGTGPAAPRPPPAARRTAAASRISEPVHTVCIRGSWPAPLAPSADYLMARA